MIKVDEETLLLEGTGVELTYNWAVISSALVRKIQIESGANQEEIRNHLIRVLDEALTQNMFDECLSECTESEFMNNKSENV